MDNIFAIMPIEAFMDDRLSKTELRVLGAIFSWRNKDTGLCWPTREQISKRCGLPLCKISTATTGLVNLGWLKKNGSGGRSMAASYQVIVPDFTQETVTDSVTVTESVTVTDSVTKTVTDSVRGIKQKYNKKEIEGGYARTHTRENLSDSVTDIHSDNLGASLNSRPNGTNAKAAIDGFNRFWDVYPKRRSRKDAHSAWLKLNPDEQLSAVIIDAVLLATTQDVQWQKDGGQFIPYPATYINQRRWEDEITPDIKNPMPPIAKQAAQGNFQQPAQFTPKTAQNIAIAQKWLEESL
jgi:hypothetical protein